MGCSKSNREEAQEGDRERAEEMHIVKVARNCLEIGVRGQYLSHMRLLGGYYLRWCVDRSLESILLSTVVRLVEK